MQKTFNKLIRFIPVIANKRYFALILIVIVIIEFIILFSSAIYTDRLSFNNSTHKVVLYDTGFQPSEIKIRKGDTVVFVNKSDKPFWPASNVHPYHTIYPQFDPKKPIDPGGTWSFKFEREGVWRFHDHITSIFEGTITVGDPDSKNYSYEDCDVNDTACLEYLIEQTMEDEGIDPAFDLVAQLFSDPEYNQDCHDLVHTIGEKAFKLYENSEDFTLSRKTTYCGYGFYHGFMETLLLTTGDTKLANEFCDYTIEASGASGAWSACYHGMGHGAVDGSDRRAWGSADAIMAPGFDLCNRLTQTDLQDYLCATGVYNAAEILSRDPKYKIAELRDDPFELCHSQPDKYKEPCYTNMLPAVLNMTEGDFYRSSKYIIEKITDPVAMTLDDYMTGEMVMLSLSVEFIRANQQQRNYIAEGLRWCRGLPGMYYLSCVEGLSFGHMKYGEPEKEYLKWQQFCRSDLLNTEEKNVCYKYVLNRIRNWYADDKAGEICRSVPQEYAGYCTLQDRTKS